MVDMRAGFRMSWRWTLLLIYIAIVPPMHSAENKSGLPALPTTQELKNLPPDGGPDFNRLVFELSPYLLQHARNPVDWHPWGDEAFEKARKEDKMVFLSIGYSTCHWCHVMEHESFEDADVAQLMNDNFVCIKVDREERPDVDALYMSVTQAMTGSGGWPMTVVMTAEKKPFFSGTYFPKQGRFGRPGMMELIPQLQNVWKEKRPDVLDYANSLTTELQKMAHTPAGDMPAPETLSHAFNELSASFDESRAGFRAQRKFPLPHNLIFLLRYYHRTQNPRALHMVERTLEAMRLGGIWDHIGYGTHRYSTDPDWLLPHFEKMLYDQALLAMAHTEAWQVTGKPFYKQCAMEIFTYVLRDMTSPEGGFFSAEDADSEGEEGLFYTWTSDEISEVLTPQDATLFRALMNFEPDGNFSDESTGHRSQRNIPHLSSRLEDLAQRYQMTPDSLQTQWNNWRDQLFRHREKRIHPLKDDKILTDWNGLMIAAMAKAGVAFQDPALIDSSRKAAQFALDHLRNPDGSLLKRFRLGEAGLQAHLEDYAFLLWGFIELHQATQDVAWLEHGIFLADYLLNHFQDKVHQGFYLTSAQSKDLISRPKEIYDGAIPSGNSAAALALVRLAKLTGQERFEEAAAGVFKAFAATIPRGPSNYCLLMTALDVATRNGQEYVIVTGGNESEAMVWTKTLTQRYAPDAVVLLKTQSNALTLDRLAPFSQAYSAIDKKTTLYQCSNHTCQQPVFALPGNP